MTTAPVDDADLTAWLCTYLPALTDAANQHRWAHKLTAAIGDIRAGTPVAQALANHHLPIDIAAAGAEQVRISRGDPGLLDDLNIDPVAVTGPYTCPATPPCPRRGQPDTHGHQPRCGVRGTTMTLRSR
ncbi:hypothetical protein [Micromonospora lupini]|uniref:Uncharacterized protein n=1 Tax=Micromonospora lupini str. Lupac 08 TaxID=1150864 RepID=I0L1Y3_9ACTN|nr:hypothetical protein [Micromonospora lupini]CCH17830.1 conserved hypothetical protein [Micromonospora lupini str. Lupac 08]